MKNHLTFAMTFVLITFLGKTSTADHGFESGDFSDWSLHTTAAGVLNAVPFSGNFHAIVSTNPDPLSAEAIELEVGLPTGAIDHATTTDRLAISGSVIEGEFFVEAGETLTFAVNFMTGEVPNNEFWDDTSLWMVRDSKGETVSSLSVVANTFSQLTLVNFGDSFQPFSSGVVRETGYFNLNFTAPTSDIYSFLFLTVNVNDPAVGSFLLVDAGDSKAVIPGDLDGDGEVTLLDVPPFVDLLSSGGYQLEADVNGDGLLNLTDVAPFVALLSN